MRPFDAVLMISFGGPQGMADVRPFLENVLRGRRVAPGRIDEVAHHYELFGGVSPLTALTMRQAEGCGNGWRPAGCRCRSTSGCATGIRSSPTRWRDVAGRDPAGRRRHRRGASQLFELHPIQGERRRGARDAARARAGRRRGHLRRRLAHASRVHRSQRRARRATRSPPAAGAPGARRTGVHRAQHPGQHGGQVSRIGSSSRRPARLVAAQRQRRRARRRDSTTRPSIRAAAAAPRTRGSVLTSASTCASLARADVAAAVLSPAGFLIDHVEVLYDLDVEAAAIASEIGLTHRPRRHGRRPPAVPRHAGRRGDGHRDALRRRAAAAGGAGLTTAAPIGPPHDPRARAEARTGVPGRPLLTFLASEPCQTGPFAAWPRPCASQRLRDGNPPDSSRVRADLVSRAGACCTRSRSRFSRWRSPAPTHRHSMAAGPADADRDRTDPRAGAVRDRSAGPSRAGADLSGPRVGAGRRPPTPTAATSSAICRTAGSRSARPRPATSPCSTGRPGRSNPGKPIELADKQTLDKADLVMPRGSAITGRIVDEVGEPVADAVVTAMRQEWSGGPAAPGQRRAHRPDQRPRASSGSTACRPATTTSAPRCGTWTGR